MGPSLISLVKYLELISYIAKFRWYAGLGVNDSSKIGGHSFGCLDRDLAGQELLPQLVVLSRWFGGS